MNSDDELAEVARVIRPYLPRLVGPRVAAELDRRLGVALAGPAGPERAREIRDVLHHDQATRDFTTATLADAPAYRPPYARPGLDSRDGDSPVPGPAGDVGPILDAGRYACPHGDTVWYRPQVGVPVPRCTTHDVPLRPVGR